MDIVHPRVAGIDVHKKVIWVAVRLPGEAPGERTVVTRSFTTFWRQLQKMAAWLAELGVTDAAMESTGVFWWPVYHALAQAGIEVCVCNAAHMRNVPGRKRDISDCRWIAELHEHGLLRPSFISAAEVAALRQRTRYRKKLIEQCTSEGQRLSKVLEDAGIKIDSVASKLLIKSGRKMIRALIAGERNPGVLADLAEGVLRRKTDELQMACDGRFTQSHGQMCALHLDACDHLTAKIAELDQLVAEAAAPFQRLIARLVTIPGIGQRTAEVIVAETGGDMTRFTTSSRLAAWAGLAPGDNESAGKRKKAPTRKGNQHLKTAMTESAWAAARTRTRPGARFRRLARRFGRDNTSKAAVAVAHTLICIAWAVMSQDQDYTDAGEDYYEQRDQRNRGLSAGTVLGLPAGQLLGHLIGWRWTFAGAAVATALIAGAQAGLLPALPAVSRMHPADLAHVLAIPLARTGLTAGAVATIAQFAGSTYVTPLLLQHAHLGTAGATMVLLGYGLAGITGTLLGSRLVSRSRIGTFAAATAAFGAVLIAIPSLTGTPGIIAVLFLAWGALWGLVPLALQSLMLQSDPGAPEAASAMFITISQLGIAAGAALGAVLVDTAGLTTLFVTSGTVAITAAVIAAVSRHGIGTVRP